MRDNREIIKERLIEVLRALRKKGVRWENMAVDLHISYGTIQKWFHGTRVPRTPLIKLIESSYGVKIL